MNKEDFFASEAPSIAVSLTGRRQGYESLHSRLQPARRIQLGQNCAVQTLQPIFFSELLQMTTPS
jgi:hypothetical protein